MKNPAEPKLDKLKLLPTTKLLMKKIPLTPKLANNDPFIRLLKNDRTK